MSQVVLVVKKLPANAGDVKDEGLIPASGRSLEEGMATHASNLRLLCLLHWQAGSLPRATWEALAIYRRSFLYSFPL